MQSAWSCLGLVATFQASKLGIFDPTLPFCDPNYLWELEFDSEEDGRVQFLQWNSVGSHLLVFTEANFILIYNQTTGLSNSWKRIETFQVSQGIQFAAWCENRCKFGWNGQALLGSNESPIYSQLFRVEFVPPGKLGFLVLRGDGVVEGFIEELQRTGQGFIRSELKLTSCAGKQSILAQRATGSILVAVEAQNSLQFFKFSSFQEEATFFGQVPLAIPPAKIIYHDSRREVSLFTCQPDSTELILTKFIVKEPLQMILERTIKLPFVVGTIVHSPRAAGVFVTSADGGLVALLNDNGDLLKTYSLDVKAGDLLLSPNGLCLGQVVNNWILSIQPVAELNPKNITAMREFVAKLITSTLNGSDAGDILQVISSSVRKSPHSDGVGLLSTLLSEWTGYIEMAGMKGEDFYGLLLELFKMLSEEMLYWQAFEIVDAVIEVMTSAKIITAALEDEDSMEVTVSTIPVLERATLRLSKQLASLSLSEPEMPCLLLLNEEFNRSCQQLVKATSSLATRLKDFSSSSTAVSAFLSQASFSLTAALNSLPGWSNTESFCSFLGALLSDPQLHSKCTKNIFGFLTDVVLDDSSTARKLSLHIYRIFSRYSSTSAAPAVTDPVKIDEFVDSVSGFKLPIGRCLPRLLQCRRCSRLTLGVAKSKTALLKSEQIFVADWQKVLWRHRCQCGSLRRQIK